MSDVTKMTNDELLEYFEAEGNKPFTSSKSPEWAELPPPAAAPVGQDYSRLAEQIIAVCGTFVPGGWAHPGDKCVALIEECLRESSPQGWVRVEDGLPKVGAWCWVVVGGVVQRMAASLAGDEWEWADREADFAPKNVVSHWQPLPAPPSAQPGEESR